MVKLHLIALVVILSGCATTQLPPEIIRVYPPAPPRIERPKLETQYLKPGDEADVVLQAHRIDIKRLQKWGLELEAILDGYRSAEEQQ